MHTVALIDDEKYVLSDIRHTFPFKAYGFCLIAALTDPIQARYQAALHPDFICRHVLTTDIILSQTGKNCKPFFDFLLNFFIGVQYILDSRRKKDER